MAPKNKNRLSPIPHPPTMPVVGKMLSLDSSAPVQNLTRLAKELGPIFWLDMMGAPIVIVSGHDLVEELSDEKRFDKAVRGPLRRVRAVAGDGLFTADTSEPNWSKAHNILLQPFGNRAMQSYHPSMVDIADQLVKKWKRLNGDEEIDVVNIRYHINTFLIAGHETTSGLLSCTLYALLKHPDVLKKAYEEIDRVLGPDLEAKPTYQQVTQLTYITQILKEALRLWPPAPAYGISPLKDETIGGKYKLKKNTFILVLPLALHRDPGVWGPHPDAFDPENFRREAEAARPVNAWKPFGNGQRACIGRGFAMHEAALAIGMILQRFKLIDHHRYQMHLKETLTINPDGFKIKVRPRTDNDRGAYAGRTTTAAAASTAAPTPRARTRPGHNTPLLVLYGSNLGTAEELATRVADLAEVNGFATKLPALDDFVGKFPHPAGAPTFSPPYNPPPPPHP